MQKDNRNSCSHEYIANKILYTMLPIAIEQFSTNAITNRVGNQCEWVLAPGLQTELSTQLGTEMRTSASNMLVPCTKYKKMKTMP